MSDIKNTIGQPNSPDLLGLIEKKMTFFQDVLQKTIIHVQKNKIFDIL